jgi:hypothetical protein
MLSLLALAALLTTLVVTGKTVSAHPAHSAYSAHTNQVSRASRAFNFSDAIFAWTTTATNVSGDSTVIDNAVTNGNPNAVLLVAHNLNPDPEEGNPCQCIYNNIPVGVWYNASIQRWEIFNEDLSAMTVGLTFNVAAWSAPFTDTTNGRLVYTHVAGASSGTDYTDIFNSMSNKNPNANVLVTPVWNPASSGTEVLNDHPVGVWYHTQFRGGTGHWSIFNEDGATMPTNAAFNVYVSSGNAVNGWSGTVLVSTSSNTVSNYAIMSTGLSNVPGFLWVTPDYDPGACTNSLYCNVIYTMCAGQPFCDVMFNHNVGVWFDGYGDSSGWHGELSVYTEDASTMPVNVAFNVLEITV